MIRLLSVAVFGVGLASAAAPGADQEAVFGVGLASAAAPEDHLFDQKTYEDEVDYEVDPRHVGMRVTRKDVQARAAELYSGTKDLAMLEEAKQLYVEYASDGGNRGNILASNRWASDDDWEDVEHKPELDVGDLVTIRYHFGEEYKQKREYKQQWHAFDVYGKQATVVRKCFSRGFGLPDTYVVRVNSGYERDPATGDFREVPDGKCPLWNHNCVREGDEHRARYGYLVRGFLQYMGQKSPTFRNTPAQTPKFEVNDFVHSTYKFALGYDTSGLLGLVIRKENPVVGQVIELKSIYPTTYYVRFWLEGAPKLMYAEFNEDQLKRMDLAAEI